MGIQNFPAALQPIIQQGFLEREFQQALKSRLGYRACADRVKISVGIGETLTRTRAGLKPSITTPLAASTNTNLDNGMTPAGWGVEQYTITINHYAATTDLNMVTSRVGHRLAVPAECLRQRRAGSAQPRRAGAQCAVQQLFRRQHAGAHHVGKPRHRGQRSMTFAASRYAFVNGVQQLVGASNPLTVTVGANAYTLVGVTADVSNVSTAPNGASGVLTFSGNVSVSDGTAGNAVTAANASVIVRPSQRATTGALTATDMLTMACLLDAVAKLRLNAVPEIDGVYNCYLDPVSARQLFADPDFKQLFQGATSANQVFRQGMTNDFLGLRFIPTTEALRAAASDARRSDGPAADHLRPGRADRGRLCRDGGRRRGTEGFDRCRCR